MGQHTSVYISVHTDLLSGKYGLGSEARRELHARKKGVMWANLCERFDSVDQSPGGFLIEHHFNQREDCPRKVRAWIKNFCEEYTPRKVILTMESESFLPCDPVWQYSGR